MEGILHVYHPTRDLLLFEHTPRPLPPTSSSSPQPTSTSTSTSSPPTAPPRPPNTLLFIGGMYDNFLTPSYTTSLSALFPSHPTQQWSVIHVQLSSAGRSFGISSLSKDVDEIRAAIEFIRTDLHGGGESKQSAPGPVVLLGHSTGCQDIMHYLTSPNPPAPNKPARPAVQGAILQAPVSDRDAMLSSLSDSSHLQSNYSTLVSLATSTPESLHTTTLLPFALTTPLFGPVPLTISRFLSLASPSSPDHPGADDFFSQDASNAHLNSTFGSITANGLLRPVGGRESTSLCVLMSGDDEFKAAYVDQESLLQRWRGVMHGASTGGSVAVAEMSPESGVVEGAKHGIGGDSARELRARLVDFRGRVVRYLESVVGKEGLEGAWEVIRRDEEEVRRKEREEGEGGDGAVGVEKGVGGMKL